MTTLSDQELEEWRRRAAAGVEASEGAPPYERTSEQTPTVSRDGDGRPDSTDGGEAGWRREVRSVPGSWPYAYALPAGASVADYRRSYEAHVQHCGACWGEGVLEAREVSRDDAAQASEWTAIPCPRCQGTTIPLGVEPDAFVEPDSNQWSAADELRAAAEWGVLDAPAPAVAVEGAELRDDPDDAVPAWERTDAVDSSRGLAGVGDSEAAAENAGGGWGETWTVDVGDASIGGAVEDAGFEAAELDYGREANSESGASAWDAGAFEAGSDPDYGWWGDGDLDYGADASMDGGPDGEGGSNSDGDGGSTGGEGDGGSGSGSDSGAGGEGA